MPVARAGAARAGVIRVRPGVRARRLGVTCLLLAGAASLSACGSGQSSTASGVSVASARTVAGLGVLNGISCPSSGQCEAVGATAPNGEGAVVRLSNGAPGPVQLVAGTKAVTAVSCVSDSSCTAVGVGGGHGIVVSLHDGQPTAVRTVSNMSTFADVSCSGGTCQGGGRSLATGALASGPTAVVTVPGTTSVNGVACSSATACEAVASTSNGKTNDVLVSLADGQPSAPQVVPPATSTFAGISCGSSTSCLVVGRGATEHSGRVTQEAVVVTVRSGAPGAVVGVPGSSDVELAAVSCASASSCVAVGSTVASGAGGSQTRGVFMSVSNGHPGAVDSVSGSALSLFGVSCPSTTQCWAVGANRAKDAAEVVSLTTGS